ncbi:MAG: anti-sigma factor antagonist [Pedosphaera sp.]|nr:anti-sigma factor antagonist [Pedosphaera sp.]
MKGPITTMQVAVTGALACVKITGPAGFSISVDFKALVKHCCEGTGRALMLDLAECVNMDSTFLGVLASLSQRTAQPIQLLNVNARITSQLDNLGVMELFQICTGPNPLTAPWQQAAPTAPADKRELAQTSLEAHRTLMALHPDNVPRFKDVEQFLKESLECKQ